MSNLQLREYRLPSKRRNRCVALNRIDEMDGSLLLPQVQLWESRLTHRKRAGQHFLLTFFPVLTGINE